MKLGMIGLARSGKSTLFEALTHIPPDEQGAHRQENRIGTIRVPDKRIDFLSDMFQPRKTKKLRCSYSCSP